VRCAIGSGALALLWEKPVRGEDDQADAFAACRRRIEDLVRRLAWRRGTAGGLCITAEDVTWAVGSTPALGLPEPEARGWCLIIRAVYAPAEQGPSRGRYDNQPSAAYPARRAFRPSTSESNSDSHLV